MEWKLSQESQKFECNLVVVVVLMNLEDKIFYLRLLAFGNLSVICAKQPFLNSCSTMNQLRHS